MIREQCFFTLSTTIIAKFFEYFPDAGFNWLSSTLGSLNGAEVPLEKEDSLLGLICQCPRLKEQLDSTTIELKFESVIGYIEGRIGATQSKLFMRRYCLILSTWAPLMSVDELLKYLQSTGQIIFDENANVPRDGVIKYEAMVAFRDLLREIEYQRRELRRKGMRGHEESASLVQKIDETLNYSSLFNIMSQPIIDILNEFESPTLIWKAINFLTLMIEGV